MRRLGIGIAILALCMMSAACGGSEEDKTDAGDDRLRCKMSSSCPVGQVCESGYCVEWTGCTPDSCEAGEICDENFECVSVSKKCQLESCECHIMSSAGGFEAEGNPKIVLPAGQSTEIVGMLSTQSGVVLPGAVFTSTVTGDSFTADGTTLTAAAAAGTADLEISFSDANTKCSADLVNIGAPAAGAIRFYIIDDSTNAPITEAEVVVDTNGDGQANGSVSASGDGQYTVSLADGEYSVTVFAEGYNILSVAGLNASDGADILLPLSARPEAPKTGGFTGKLDYTAYEKRYLNNRPAAIKLGIATGSIPFKSLLNFNLDLFVGEITDADCDEEPTPAGCTQVDIPGLTDPNNPTIVALPGGLVLGLSDTEIKGNFDSVARPGRRFAWGLGTELNFPDISGLISILTPVLTESGDSDEELNIDIGSVLQDVVPLLSSFATALKGNLALPATEMTQWVSHITPDYDDRVSSTSFPKLDDGATEEGQLSFREGWSNFSVLKVPALPSDWGAADDSTAMEGMLTLTGVDAQGFGFIPLGLGVAVDCTQGNCLNPDADSEPGVFDGVVNGGPMCKFNADPEKNRCSPTILAASDRGVIADGNVGVFHAPAFGGLEGYTPKTLLLSLPVSDLLTLDLNDGFRATAIVHSGKLDNGANNAVASRQFSAPPGLPEALAGRKYTVSDSGHTLHWVTLATATAADGSPTTRWNVYIKGGKSFTAPAVPAGFADPFAESEGGDDVDIPEGKVNATHVGFNLDGVTLVDLAKNNGTDLNTLFDSVTGMSIETKNLTVE